MSAPAQDGQQREREREREKKVSPVGFTCALQYLQMNLLANTSVGYIAEPGYIRVNVWQLNIWQWLLNI